NILSVTGEATDKTEQDCLGERRKSSVTRKRARRRKTGRGGHGTRVLARSRRASFCQTRQRKIVPSPYCLANGRNGSIWPTHTRRVRWPRWRLFYLMSSSWRIGQSRPVGSYYFRSRSVTWHDAHFEVRD